MNSAKPLTRREFLRWSSAVLAVAALPPLPESPGSLPLPADDLAARAQVRLGRGADWRATVQSEPNPRAPVVRRIPRDYIVNYFEEVEAEGYWPSNSTWLRVRDGYAYSAHVQPVERRLNRPLPEVPEEGVWGEVTVPYVNVHAAPSKDSYRVYRFYYGTVYRILERTWGDDGQVWYRLWDNLMPGRAEWVPAATVCPIPPEDLTPISPQAAEKHVEISLSEQRLRAFEGRQQVYECRICSGMGGDYSTPQGHHYIFTKTGSRHMVGGNREAGDYYDLPGVPFTAFFWGAVALHGVYWHNDFGRPRSHGCVNVPNAAARWLYRWSEPLVPYSEKILEGAPEGTVVHVYW